MAGESRAPGAQGVEVAGGANRPRVVHRIELVYAGALSGAARTLVEALSTGP
ncbi:hypothetical protein [Streptomyces zaehneri]|uniref:hypothetical protein n=1 Tax=Streptomyces zaehneri TaxID=3051180 RepID=UPI0028D30A66|nr:hypothetical protein [Streptomyces sp. DSM 40713]